MQSGGLDFNSSQNNSNNNQFQSLLVRIRELEEQNTRLLNQVQELNNERSIQISNSFDLSRISNGSQSLSLGGGEPKECRYLSDFLTELERTDFEKIRLRPGDDFDSPEGTFETKISFSQKAIKSICSEFKGLEKENKELRQYKNKHESEKGVNLKYKEINPEPQDIKEYYDCRIIADSCFSLLWPEKHERWRIEFRDYLDYKIKAEQESICVSVVGHENKGKSFVISQVLGHEIPQGEHQRTVGIGALYPHEDLKNVHCIALDTPGTNMAVRTELKMNELMRYFDEKNLSQAERLRRLYGDVRIMESLLHEFVMKHAEILLVVVPPLGTGDQHFLNSIKERNRIAKKRILVIHNWSSCNQVANVEELIQSDIKKTFKTQERVIGRKDEKDIYAYEEKSEEGGITHVILAHQGSPAGNLYNDFALEYIRNIIRGTNIVKRFDLLESFKQHLETHIENHLYRTTENLRNHDQEEIFSLQYNVDSEPSSLFLNNASTFDLKGNTVNEIGILKTYVQGRLETVPYVIKRVKIALGNRVHDAIQIEFEVCGICRDIEAVPRILNNVGGTTMTVTITATSEDNGAQRGVILESTRNFGRFKIVTGEIDIGNMIIDLPQGRRGIEITEGNSGLKTATIFLTTLINQNGF